MFASTSCSEMRPVSVLLGGSGINGTIKRHNPVPGVLLMPHATGDACRSKQKDVVPKP